MKTKFYLLSLLTVVISLANTNAQIWVGDLKETGTLISGGSTTSANLKSIWIGEVFTGRIIQIDLYPLQKEYGIYDYTVNSMQVVGKKGAIYWSMVNSFSEADQTFFAYDSLQGVLTPIQPGGRFDPLLFPKTSKGNRLWGAYDKDNIYNNQLYQGTRTLTLDLKKTQLYNFYEFTVEEAANLIIKFYEGLGYTKYTN